MCYPCTHCNKCGKFPAVGTCMYCGAPNDANALVCAKCGKPFPPKPGQAAYPEMGKKKQ